MNETPETTAVQPPDNRKEGGSAATEALNAKSDQSLFGVTYRTRLPKAPVSANSYFAWGFGLLIAFGLSYLSGRWLYLRVWSRPTSRAEIGADVLTGSSQILAPGFTAYDPQAAERDFWKMQHDIAAAGRRGEKIALVGPALIEPQGQDLIPPGTFAKAKLESGASNGPVRAVLTEPIIVNGAPVIESETLLLGRGTSNEQRLMVAFTKAVLSSGKSFKIHAEAADVSDKIVGLKGSKVGSRMVRLAAGIGLNFLSGMSEALQDTQRAGPMGVPVKAPSMKNALLNGSEKASLEEGNSIMEELKNSTPVIEVPEGQELLVLFDSEGE
ncbi:MAG: TrbI/VirB10 family protein [Bdellovibrionales bacterium]|nr:TrbI/VirB10 family protein [Bdellovibrionales bacterium]